MKMKQFWLFVTSALFAALVLFAPVAGAQTFKTRAAQGVEGLGEIHKFGFNADIASTEETVWDQGGLYTYPSSAGQLGISSSSTLDAAAAAGALTVEIFGLDGNYVEINETLTMNGQTSVQTTNSYLRIFRAIVRTAGASEFNVGDVYVGTGVVSSGVPVTKYLKVTAQQNQTLMALWTVPANKWFYLTHWQATTFGQANQSLEFRLMVRPENEVFQVKRRILLFRSPVEWPQDIPQRFAPKTDIEIRAKASGGSIDASASFQGYIMGQ